MRTLGMLFFAVLSILLLIWGSIVMTTIWTMLLYALSVLSMGLAYFIYNYKNDFYEL
jgi:hypothetical protein